MLERGSEILLDERAHLLAVQVLGGMHQQTAANASQDVCAVVARTLPQPGGMPGRRFAAHDDVARHLRVTHMRQ